MAKKCKIPDLYVLTNTERLCFDKYWKTLFWQIQFSFQLDLDVSRSAHNCDDFLHLDRPWQGVSQLPLRGHPHSWRGFGLELNSFATSFPGLLPEATFPSPQPGRPPLGGEGCLGPHLWRAVGAPGEPHHPAQEAARVQRSQPDCRPPSAKAKS